MVRLGVLSLKCGVWFMRREIEVYYQDYFSLVAIMDHRHKQTTKIGNYAE